MYRLIAVRTEPSEDFSHEHIALVGYDSPHMPGEPIMIPPERVIMRLALAERFWVDVDGEKADVQPGACEVCGHEPQLKTSADEPGRSRILELPPA